MKRVALYARVSTKKQDAEPQLTRLREWAKNAGLQVVGEFIETASGRLVRRPEQDKVMALARGHHTQAVAVVKLDRWGRSLMDLRRSIEELVKAGVVFHAVEQGISYEKDTPVGKLFLSQLGAFAEFEADLISERTRDGMAGRAALGWPDGKPGRPLAACHDCGAPRFGPGRIRGKRAGVLVPLCPSCKSGVRNRDAPAPPTEPAETGASVPGRIRNPPEVA